MGSCNSTKNGVENEYEYGNDHLVMLGKQMLHNLMIPMVLLLRHQLVWKHHNKDETAQLLNEHRALIRMIPWQILKNS